MCGDTCGNSAMQMPCEGRCGMCNLCFLGWLQRTLGTLLALTSRYEDRRFILVGENADQGSFSRPES